MPTAQEIINGLSSQAPQEESDFSEVDHRITTAQYYRLLLSNSLFADDSSPAAQQVEKDIREFVKKQIRILIGLEAPTLQVIERDPVFSSEEIVALKELAHRLLGTTPEVTPIEVKEVVPEPPKPALKPITKKNPLPKKPNKPMLRKTEVPEYLKEDTDKMGTETPVVSQVVKALTGPQPGEVGSAEFVELEPNPKTGAPRIRKNGKILERATNPQDGSIVINAQGGEVWLDVTPPAQPPPGSGYIPMPRNDAFASLGERDALQARTRVEGGQLAGIVDLFLK